MTASFRREFGALASDQKQFHATMRTVFGEGYNAVRAEQFRQQALAGDFRWLPPVKLVSAETLQGGHGAYDAASGTVLINQSLDPALAASTFVEEAGHHLDTQLNTQDTQGDEGELFRRILSGEKLSSAQVAEIRAENDKGIIRVDGKDTEVEFRNPLKALGKAFKKAGNAVGNAISSGAKAVGNVVKTAATRVFDGVRGIGTGIFSILKSQWLNIREGFETYVGGIGQLFQGKFAKGFLQMGKGLLKPLVQTPIDRSLMLVGRLVSAIQTQWGVEPVGRKLNSSEIATLRKVYGNSINYSNIRIKEGDAGLLTAFRRPFTHGNTIYIPKGRLPLENDDLIHEAAHVWQHQHGGTDYMSEALWAQRRDDAYDVGEALAGNKSWSQMHPEHQATLLEAAFIDGYFDNPSQGFFHEGRDYTAVIQDAVAQVRAGKGAP
ncbi:hypothetical protein [Stigmatella erecta]|uniref:DUF4157 domain-containing protein n=1 Tax=Stigmatella erecta TaxID=83460 RepID=A0A1I0AWJ4_9BACT|nr:hypothetical protein [Stigmatella erecta]SES98747.1 hypothetical protein SAMN05443639_101833 [Stigmatella erecta]